MHRTTKAPRHQEYLGVLVPWWLSLLPAMVFSPMQAFESLELLREVGPALGVKFVVAVLCGAAIGLERETSGKPAGLRTNILICLGSTLFTTMSVEISRLYGGDAARLTAQIVSGIGFLGAG